MPRPDTVELFLPAPEDTAAAARLLAPLLGPGDSVLLSGGLGTGKTHFARALIQARLIRAGVQEEVPSPTYTLVQTYDDGTAEIWHADLYRLGDPLELAELGLEEAFAKAIVLVEWPDRLGPLAPENALGLTFRVSGQGRALEARWDDPRLAALAGFHA